MKPDEPFTAEQLLFLEIWHIAAKYDCLYILDFYCENHFEHDRVNNLTDKERAELALSARREIFAIAIENGYTPIRNQYEASPNGYLC